MDGSDATERHGSSGVVATRIALVFHVKGRRGEWSHSVASLKVQVPGLGSEALVGKKGGREEPRWLPWKYEKTMLLAAEATGDPSAWWQMAY